MTARIPELSTIRPAVVGLGYVGLPLAVALAKHFPTLGYDVSTTRIAELGAAHDASGEVAPEELRDATGLRFTDDARELASADVYIVAVPTPVTRQKHPDLAMLVAASTTVAKSLRAGAVVIYESTVYPGATEETCIPVLERVSGLRCNQDFHVGYSPERINPGDRRRRLGDIVKVTSGSTPEAAAFVDALYRSIVPAGTHLAPSIRVAEAAKAIENTQRDVNIALMNEFAQIFERLGLDTEAVLAAAGSKWNFLPFRPGLVGGHCIGVDPYYLIHKAEEAGVYPELIRAARRINDGMSGYVVSRLLALMARHGMGIAGSRVLVLGVTFKENCSDLRNTRVVEIVDALRGLNAEVDVVDPWADPDACLAELRIPLLREPQHGVYHAVLIAVAHAQFAGPDAPSARAYLRDGGVLFDLKYVVDRRESDARL